MVTDPPRGSARRRWPLWIALGLVALGGALVLAVVVLLPPARVRALIQAQLGRTLAREVSFESASVSLWPPIRLQVRTLRLAEPGGFARGAAFETRALALDLDLLALLARRFVVRRLVVEGPALHLVLGPGSHTNFEGLMRPQPAGGAPGKPGAGAEPLELAVQELAITGAKIRVEDVNASRRFAFDLDSRLGFSLERGGARVATEGSTGVRGLAFGPLALAREVPLNRSLAKIEWRIDHRGKYDAESRRLALERLALGAGRAEVVLSGIADGVPGETRVDFRARGASLDLADVMKAVAAADARALHGIQGSGRLAFDLGVRGALAPGRAPEVTGTIAIADGAFRYSGAPAGIEALAFTARLAPDSLGIADLAARVAGQPFRAQLALTHFADPVLAFALRGDVDLAAVAPLLAARDTRLAGRASIDLRGYGRAKQRDAMALEGGARLSGVRIESPALPKPVEQVSGELAFSAARAEIRGLTARAGQSSFTLDGTATRPLALLASPGKTAPADVDFTLRSPYLDLAELLPVTPGSPVLPNARGLGRVEIKRLIKDKLDASNVRARVALTPGVLDLTEFSFDGYGGAVRGTGRFDLRDAARPVYAVKARVDTVEADRLLSAWTPARGLLHGVLNTTLDFSGVGSTPDDIKRSLTAIGRAALADGTLGPGPAFEALSRFTKVPELKEVRFKDLKLPFRVENGRMITDPVVLEGANGEWRFSGGIGFDGSLDYAVSTTLPRDVVEKLGADAALAAGALADDNGRILLDLRVSGNARSPRIAWDAEAMGERAKGRLSSALDKQRKRLESELLRGLEPKQSGDGAGAFTSDSARASAADSARRARRAMEDSLKKAARGLLEGLFGGGKKDTTRR